MDGRSNNGRNPTQTPLHPSCRLCHYAGFSNLCNFSRGGECPYVSLRRTLARENGKMAGKSGG